MFGAMSRLFWNWSKRVSPRKASRRIRMLHHSPTRSRLRAIGQVIDPKLLRCMVGSRGHMHHASRIDRPVPIIVQVTKSGGDANPEVPHIPGMAEFRSIYRHGFARVAACTTRCTLADPAANAAAMLEVAEECDRRGVALAVFPELGLSGYAISDLLHQSVLLDAVEAEVAKLVEASAGLLPLLLVGAPLRHAGALYNCALAIHRGRLLGVVPKAHLPNYREFYEPRHFVVGGGMPGSEIALGGVMAPFGTDLLF